MVLSVDSKCTKSPKHGFIYFFICKGFVLCFLPLQIVLILVLLIFAFHKMLHLSAKSVSFNIFKQSSLKKL